jgi:hypothetical protein
MPKGPKGEKRPADVIGAAVMVAKIATGEIEDKPEDDGKDKAAQELGRKGGAARASRLSEQQRSEIARKAAEGRWSAAAASSDFDKKFV